MAVLARIIVVVIFLLCGMNCFTIMILTVPILLPVLATLPFDLIWFGVIMVIVLEIGLMTPPVGMNVFVLKAAA